MAEDGGQVNRAQPPGRWRSALYYGLVWGVLGPIAGALLLTGFAAWLGAAPEPAHSVSDRVLGGLLLFVLFWLYGIVLVGPVALVLGTAASWFLLWEHARGAARRTLSLHGAMIGGTLGVLGLPLAWHAGIEPANPYTLAALITGVLLGWYVGCHIGRGRADAATPGTRATTAMKGMFEREGLIMLLPFALVLLLGLVVVLIGPRVLWRLPR